MVVAKAEEREKPRVKTVGEGKSIAMVMVMGRTEEKEKRGLELYITEELKMMTMMKKKEKI